MYGLTPFERRALGIFNAFNACDNDCGGKSSGYVSFKTDIRDEGNKYIMKAELPGFEKGEIKLDVNGDTLILTAEHTEQKIDNDNNKNYICRERSYNSYQRAFDISEIDVDGIEAEYKNGILYMILPKKMPKTPANRRLVIK